MSFKDDVPRTDITYKKGEVSIRFSLLHNDKLRAVYAADPGL